MKVRILRSLEGSVDGHNSPNADDVLTVSDSAGALLCGKGFAEPVVEERIEKRPAAVRTEKRTAKKG